MSGGAGHILDMMNRIRQNAALKSSRKNKFKGNNRSGIYSKEHPTKLEFDFPKASKDELEQLKNNLKKESNKEKNKLILLISIAVIVFIIAFLLFNYYS